ncbi:3201_t:CDS:2 [Funneliformis caledonium]|uniref:3201_t:CDS:1 n=1 Tax=Funneliformis caledonium TaxID=1117310 RepID=A0A9N8ZS32_9GLOM|nr:3201_t:CDS:2 [Funneliformis caledonium]
MPATRKHLHISKPRRRQRSVSLTTRASRCGVKNYINVLKSIHPSVETFFPVTKQYLQEYIDAKKKQGTIKANSLDQYFQHIESYNMALGHGWDSQEFEPMMRDVLEELVQNEERTGQRKTTSTAPGDDDDESLGQDDINDSSSIQIVCFDMLHVPPVKLERNARIPMVTNDETMISLPYLHNAIATAKFPKKWGKVDRSMIYYRTETWKDAPHYGLSDENTFKNFCESWSNQREGSEVQLVLYAKPRSTTPAATIQPLQLPSNSDSTMISSNIPLAPLTPRKSPPRLQQIPSLDFSPGPDSATPSPTFIQLKSVTIRSPTRIYKQNIAVSDKTTFSSLLSFAIKKPAPQGKQFVLQSADGELEYMPEDPVRKVIYGSLHADVIVKMEDVREVDFAQFYDLHW